jgi:hypothetical protein
MTRSLTYSRSVTYFGAMATMTEAQSQSFLADLHVGVLSVADPDPSRGPLTIPIWYEYSPADGVTIITSPTSRKGKAIEAAGRFSLVAQQESLPYMYVSVEGPVVETVPCDLEAHLRPMAVRYLGERAGNAYAESWAAGPSVDLVYRMQPEHWFTFDFSDEIQSAG